MTTGKTIKQLKMLKASVLADGKVDWNETEQLLNTIRPLAVKRGFLFEDYERLLVKCREDGKITPDESKELALQLDYLCTLFSNLQLRFWLTIALIALLVACTFALAHGVATTAARSSRTDMSAITPSNEQ